MDQVIANQIGYATRIASMQIGIDGGGNSGNCDSGCAYSRNISWASETQPLSKATSPQVIFSSEIEDGNARRHRNLPVILAGSCHGAYSTGRHIEYEPNKSTDGPPIANLFLSMMAAMGVNQGSFGDNSTGLLGQL